MSSRFTQTEKWDDKWFRGLTVNAKVLYWYIWDKCNIAGFWEVDLDGAIFHTKIKPNVIRGAYEELSRGLVGAGEYVWVRKFLYHQKNLPLNPENNAHRGILRCIEEYKTIFPNVLEELQRQSIKEKKQGAAEGLDSPTSICKGKGKGISKGKSKEVKKKYLDFVLLSEDEYKKLIDKFGLQPTADKIEELNRYIGKIGEAKANKKYDSHYFVILTWDRKNGTKNNPPYSGKNGGSTDRDFSGQESKYGQVV